MSPSCRSTARGASAPARAIVAPERALATRKVHHPCQGSPSTVKRRSSSAFRRHSLTSAGSSGWTLAQHLALAQGRVDERSHASRTARSSRGASTRSACAPIPKRASTSACTVPSVASATVLSPAGRQPLRVGWRLPEPAYQATHALLLSNDLLIADGRNGRVRGSQQRTARPYSSYGRPKRRERSRSSIGRTPHCQTSAPAAT